MNIPKTVQVSGATYKVIETDKMPGAGDDPNIYVHGLCDATRKTIYINKADSDKVKRETLLHEILHAIIAQAGLTHLMAHEMEEALVCALENGLMNLIKSGFLIKNISKEP